MRIVQLTDQYLPSIGGTERHVARLSGSLVERGHQVCVLTMAREGLPEREHDANGVEILRVDAPEIRALRRLYSDSSHSFHPPTPLPGTARAIARALSTWRPDVVHGHNWFTYPYLSVKRHVGAPAVHTFHDHGSVCPKMTKLLPDQTVCSGPSFLRCVRCATDQLGTAAAAGLTTSLRLGWRWHRHVDRPIAVSQIVAASHQPVFTRTIEVVPSFIPDGLGEDVANATRPGFLPEGDYLLFVGALSRHKGLPDLLHAHRLLGDGAPPLVLCGVRKTDTPSIDQPGVIVVENVPHADVMAAWRHALVGILPSLSESWGQVVAEAMTVGCPVVVSDTVGLAPQVAQAEAGIVFPVRDVDALSSALARLIADPQERVRLGTNGKALSATLTVSSVVGKLEEIFMQVVDESRAA